jgi:hypothetical protein
MGAAPGKVEYEETEEAEDDLGDGLPECVFEL